jgi:hypothetical protein
MYVLHFKVSTYFKVDPQDLISCLLCLILQNNQLQMLTVPQYKRHRRNLTQYMHIVHNEEFLSPRTRTSALPEI